jgi:outer membrane receptor for ferrienterochelin and colicin
MRPWTAVGSGVVTLLVLLLPLSAEAQVATALVEGRVLDPSGAPAPGATVTLRHLGTGASRTAVANTSGLYRIAALPVGPYEVQVELTGFVTQVRSGIVLRVGQQASLDFTLAVAPVQELVTVQADAPMIQTTKSALGATITTRQIDELAVADRNFSSLAYLVPGVANTSGGSDDAETGIGSSGAKGTGNTFLIDGLSADGDALSESRGLYSLDAIAEYEVLTTQYSAEFGQASGAVLNVVTRSGTNDVQGRVFGYYRADELSANDPFVQADPVTGETEEAPFSQKVFGGTLGGPIVKDRTFFFLSYDHTLRDETAVVAVDQQILTALGVNSETSLPRPMRRPLVMGKLVHQLSPDQSLTARYRLDHRSEENFQVGGTFTGEVGATVTRTNQDIGLLHTWVISPETLNEVRFQYAWQPNDITDVNCPDCPFISRPGFYTGKAASFPQEFSETRFQVMDTYSFSLGSDHFLKAGVDYSKIGLDGFVEQNFDGFFIFQTVAPFDPADPTTHPLIWQGSEGDPSFDVDNDIVALFLQDQWRLAPNLTLNLGLRWDYEHSVATKDNKANFGPRLHFVWDPWKNGETAIRGGYGRYYDQVFLNVILFSELLDGSLTTTTLFQPGYPDPFVGGAGIPLPNPPPTIFRFQDDLETPYTDTVSIGFQRELAPDLALGVDGVFARGRNQLALIDVNYAGPGVPRLDPNFTQINEIQAEGRMNYRALQVGLQKRFRNSYALNLAYTLSDTKRDTDGHQFRPQDPRDLAAEYGPSDIDARHNFAGSANWEAFWGIHLGLSGRFLSALPYNVETGTDDNGDLSVNDRPPGVSRNSEREESAWSMDLRLAKAFNLGNTRLEVIGEVFNLFNHSSRSGFVGNMQAPNFGEATEVAESFPPRQVQLGFRLDF